MNELTPILLEPAPFSLFSHRDRRAERLPPRTVLFAARIRGKTGVSSFFQPIDELTTFPSLGGKTGVSSFFQPIDELTTFPSLGENRCQFIFPADR
jgi:hypothetical protein